MKVKIKNKNTKIALFSLSLLVIASVTTYILLTPPKEKILVSKVGSIETGGGAVDVDVIDGIAYISEMRANALKIINVSDPSNPVLLSSYEVSGNHQLSVQNQIVYITDHNRGLVVINVTNASHPVFISRYSDPGFIDDLYIVNDTAYVIDQDDGLEIVDISDPTNLVKLGSFNFGGTGQYNVDVIIRDNIAYLTDQVSGFYIADVSDPTNITELYHYEGSGMGWMDIYNDFLYIPNQQTVLLFNIEDPESTKLIREIKVGTGPFVITIKNDLACVSTDTEGVKILDLSNPRYPKVIGSFNNEGMPFMTSIENDYIYVAGTSSGLEILQMTPLN
ncbi:LVIVD repeat-containing protein [Candidatus Lokiarchaeum ossiferum]|uniref:LVIVD repeat-containing protein n=1 Tax=Candidatus Lokiarchaeum ossiferum TaxID=2951803 RepID=UPI00352FC163